MKWISDPGHGWLEVDLKECPAASKYCSSYSFTNGHQVWLEEDVDAHAFSLFEEVEVRDLPEQHVSNFHATLSRRFAHRGSAPTMMDALSAHFAAKRAEVTE